MLVLSRSGGEVIHIGDHIKVTVVKLERGRVRLGIDAPKDVRVVRSELAKWDDVPTDEAHPSLPPDQVDTPSTAP